MRKPRRTTRFYVIYFAVVLIFFFSVGEAASRLAGYTTWSPKADNFKVEPGGRLFEKDAKLGYKNVPGRFTITLGGALVYTVTNLGDGSRATSVAQSAVGSSNKPGIWIFGDSFPYGWSVSDNESFPWLLQEDFPDYEVKNFAVGGYGPLHSLIQLRDNFQKSAPPKLVVFIYASWLDHRTTAARRRRKTYFSSMGQMTHPHAKLSDGGEIQIYYDDVAFRAFPLARYSAFMNMLDEIYTKYEEPLDEGRILTKAIIKEMAVLSKTNGSEMVVGTVTNNPETDEMVKYCHELGLKTVDISIALRADGNSNLPYDIHPSAAGHRRYEQKLKPFIAASLASYAERLRR